jgi:hypothetical protein
MYNTTCQICGKTSNKIVNNLYPLQVCSRCVLAVDKNQAAANVVSQILEKVCVLRQILAEAYAKEHKDRVESKERIS